MAAAALDTRSEDADDALRGLERLDNAEVAPLRDAEQAARLAAIIARTDLDPWDAHVAAVADASVCPILTLDAARWRQPRRFHRVEAAVCAVPPLSGRQAGP
jgi:predicted nucleic acid-binding protein